MPRAQLSRTLLSKQAGVLRASLWLSLGLSPLACGGTAITASGGDGGGSAQAGAGDGAGASSAGALSHAGNPSNGGAPSYAGAGSAGGASSVTACSRPIFDPITKLITCSNGLVHRAQALTCTFDEQPAGEGGAPGAGGEAGAAAELGPCQSNADCTGLRYGYCDNGGSGFEAPVCRSGCTTDSDCENGICACDGETPGRCVAAGCRVDADCPPDSLCAYAVGVCGGGSFQCTSPQDECITNMDCAAKGGGQCTVQGGHRTCDGGVVCGRPFLIAREARMADIETRADWLDVSLAPDPSGLTPVQRAQLAAHWARLGQMEHASIAAFARFQMQLLSLGAPSDLVEACNRALADETSHTRTCFALASAYGGIVLGPARLDIAHCFEDTSLTAIAKLVLREGCLGETVASLEALAAAEVATDPAVKQALTRIAKDELSHAELAFEFLRWALTLSTAEARHEIACEAAQQLADFESNARHGERTHTDDRLAAHGLIAGDALRAIHLAAVRDVTRPLLAALFDAETSNEA
jgi:hypothetical protein